MLQYIVRHVLYMYVLEGVLWYLSACVYVWMYLGTLQYFGVRSTRKVKKLHYQYVP